MKGQFNIKICGVHSVDLSQFVKSTVWIVAAHKRVLNENTSR